MKYVYFLLFLLSSNVIYAQNELNHKDIIEKLWMKMTDVYPKDQSDRYGIHMTNLLKKSLKDSFSEYPSLNLNHFEKSKVPPVFKDDSKSLEEIQTQLFAFLYTLKSNKDDFKEKFSAFKKSIVEEKHPWFESLQNTNFETSMSTMNNIMSSNSSNINYTQYNHGIDNLSDEQLKNKVVFSDEQEFVFYVNKLFRYLNEEINGTVYQIAKVLLTENYYIDQISNVDSFFKKISTLKNPKFNRIATQNIPNFGTEDVSEDKININKFKTWVISSSTIDKWKASVKKTQDKFEHLRTVIVDALQLPKTKYLLSKEDELQVQMQIVKTLFYLYVLDVEKKEKSDEEQIKEQVQLIQKEYQDKYQLNLIYIEGKTKNDINGESKIGDFLVSQSEITVGQYRKCVEANVCWLPSSLFKIADSDHCNYLSPDERINSLRKWEKSQDQYPMNCLTWKEALIYSKWIAGDLPSEQEWEYIARSASLDQKIDFDKKETCSYLNFSSCSKASTDPVCFNDKAKTKQGVCDMQYNLSEWVKDESDSKIQQNPLKFGPFCDSNCDIYGKSHKVKGGNWGNQYTHDINISSFSSELYKNRKNYIGFRVIIPRPAQEKSK